MTPPLPAGFTLVALNSVGSTNDEAKRLGAKGASDGTVVWAKRQEAGRGRRGRQWHSPEGNLYCSLVLRPACTAPAAAQLSFVAALALDRAFGEVLPPSVERRLKWPNDVLLNGAKAAGILLEAEANEAAALDFVVLGMGVNIAHKLEATERPTVSLGELGADCAVPDFLSRLLAAFVSWRAVWQAEGFEAIRLAWLARSFAYGSPITVRLPSERVEGGFAGMDQMGTLLVDVGLSAPRRITAGDVFFG